ncbi:csc1-like protein 1 [Dermatophagoides farinae]|uniref:Csc1-like protein 1 n=1 Tax=Dermatophagoides farinae TaxID=6954 RepID=A0A9D4P275_DERFA|nr:csc1-like protein 1 [Dermatophagoides farinae]
MRNCVGANCCKHLLANYTNIYHHVDGMDDIIEAIIFNFFSAIILLAFLAVVRLIYFRRKQHGRNWNKDWLDFIYSDREVDLLHDEKPINSSHPNAYLHSCLHDYSHLITNKYMSDEWDELISISYDHKFQDIKKSHQAKLNSVGQKRHWLLDYTFIKDEDILKHRGKDASNYLLFQRYIIYILTFLSIVSMTILTPVNMSGGNSLSTYYEMTTINNVKKTSSLLWIHTITAVVIVIIGIFIMKKFSDYIFLPQQESTGQTILIQNLPKKARDAQKLKKFIEVNFSDVEVTRITYTYEIETIRNLQKDMKAFQFSLDYCEQYQRHYGRPLLVRPYMFGLICPQCPLCGICYYQHQFYECQRQIEIEVIKTINQPQHAAFVRLKNSMMAQKILDHFEITQHTRLLYSIYSCAQKFCNFDCSDYSDDDPYGYNQWITQSAPFPEDVEWNDIIMNNRTSYICSFVLNLLTIIIFLFLTTPIVAMNFLQEILIFGMDISIEDNEEKQISIGFLQIKWAKYLSALIMNGLACILPNLIMLIELFVPQTSKSEKNSKIMRMVYLYLILMVLIFPSLGLMSGQLLIKKITDKSFPRDFYKCLFPATSSQFFIYYVISCIFINTPVELLRLPELGSYVFNCIIHYPKTEAEYGRARMETNFQFSYGSNYPRFLLIFTIVITYSIASPILAPLVYFLMKFFFYFRFMSCH